MPWLHTRRRKIQNELAITNERLRMALESGRSVGWDWDIRSGRDQWFGDLQTMFGIPSETYVGRIEDFHQRVHPDDRKLATKAVADARQSRLPYTAEFRVIRADGTVRWITARGKFYYAANGEAVRMLGIAVDITDRKQTEQALRESEERFRLVANNAPVMIWMSGVDKLCFYFNQRWLEFTGRSLDAEMGNGWVEGVHSEDRMRVVDLFTTAFDQHEPFQMEYRLRRADREYRWVLDSGVPRFGADGFFAGYIGSAIDITELKLAEEALSTVNRRLIEAHEEERTFLARELHDDISQRLALLILNLEGLRRGPHSIAEFGEGIGKAIQEASNLGKDMRALSHRLHSPKLEYSELVGAAAGYCSELASQHNVEIDIQTENVPSGISQEISICMFRVLQEALQNAIKHSGARRFQVSLTGGSNEILLSVHDSGIGFDLDEALKGRGLGLTSMKERLKLVAGELSIESQGQTGTTIHVRVPLKSRTMSAEG